MNDSETIFNYILSLGRSFTRYEIYDKFGYDDGTKRKLTRLRRTGYITKINSGNHFSKDMFKVKEDLQ